MRRSFLARLGKLVIFLGLLLALACGLSLVLTPKFNSDARYSVQGIYDQPKDSVEVAAFGTSTLRKAFSPDYLYENFGIASWNSCTNGQPAVSSYYLLKDMAESQGGSLKVVLLDAGPLVKKEGNSVGAERVAACMRPSPSSVEHAFAIAREYDGVEAIEQLIPILRYHDRWSELEEDDFDISIPDEQAHLHGQNITSTIFASNTSLGNAGKYTRAENDAITPEVTNAEDELRSLWTDMSLRYYDKMVDFCNENGIAPVLVKIPQADWTDEKHDSVSLYASERGVTFIDLTEKETWNECRLSYDDDFSDNEHPNLIGSTKISGWLGKYLSEAYELKDARNDASSGFTEDDHARYAEMLEDASLHTIADLEAYLAAINRSRYTIFIAVRGEAAAMLSEEAREVMKDMSLEKLGNLSVNESYAGVLSGGECIKESVNDKGKRVSIAGAHQNGKIILRKQNMQTDAMLDNPIEISSVGKDSDSDGTISLMNRNKSENKRGINFVVYDEVAGCIVDTASFDTHASSARTSDLP